MRILYVEDDESVADFVINELQFENYGVNWYQRGDDGYQAFLNEPDGFDLVLLDWMLPGLSGFDLCRQIRRISSVPIILLTARDFLSDRVSALDNGADDYVSKPFEIAELLARIRALMRRQTTKTAQRDQISIGGLQINRFEYSVHYMNQRIDLSLTEFKLLLYLVDHAGVGVSRDELLDKVWGFEYTGETNVVDVYISYLRRKLNAVQPNALIETIRGVGYRFDEETD